MPNQGGMACQRRLARHYLQPAVAHPVLRGVDDRKRLVRVARIALGSERAVEETDPAGFEFTEPGSVVLSDVLRHCDGGRWRPLMARAMSALGPRDVLVVYDLERPLGGDIGFRGNEGSNGWDESSYF